MSDTNKQKDIFGQGSNDPKNKKKKPLANRPFNPYWIYVVIAVILISQLLFSFSSGTKTVEWKEFVNEMLLEGDVSRVVVVRYENLAEIYVDPNALSKEKYAEVQRDI